MRRCAVTSGPKRRRFRALTDPLRRGGCSYPDAVSQVLPRPSEMGRILAPTRCGRLFFDCGGRFSEEIDVVGNGGPGFSAPQAKSLVSGCETLLFRG